jgi:putative ABC transport system permease protein
MSSNGEMASAWTDIRYALRMLRGNPEFAGVALLVLALSIGATTAMFSVVQAVLIRPLPYRAGDRLVAITRLVPRAGTPGSAPLSAPTVAQTVSLTDVEIWRDHSRTLAGLGSFVYTQLPVKIGDLSYSMVTAGVDPELLATLGTPPALGVNFAGHGHARKEPAAIISHRLWVSAFDADRTAIGRRIAINGDAYTIAGVLPDSFRFPRADASYFTEDVDLLIPIANIVEGWNKDSGQWFAIGRLQDGVTPEQAQAELTTFSPLLAAQIPSERGMLPRLRPLHDETTRHVRPALLLMMATSLVLLLLACTNIMNLLFSRSVARGREMAIRLAVGASRGRLIRQMLTESIVLTGIGGLIGLVLARLALNALVSLSPFHLPVSGTIRIDGGVIAFTGAMCVAAAMIAGLFPAWHAGRDREQLLGGTGTRAAGGRTSAWSQRVLTVTQVALGLALLTAAGLLTHSLWRLSSVEPGFRHHDVFGFSISVPGDQDHPMMRLPALYARLLEATRTVPGVQSAGWITSLPPELRKGVFVGFAIQGHPPEERLRSNVQIASEGYFQTVGIPLQRGRDFTPADTAASPFVVIVNEALASRYFPNSDPIGQHIFTFGDSPREIVGVIRTIHDRGLATATVPTVYIPLTQTVLPYGSIAVQATVPAASLIPEIRRRLQQIDASVPVTEFQTLDARLSESLDEPRFYTVMATSCAIMAVLFVTLGLYGLVSHAVSRRTGEIGIRMALGAERTQIRRMVLWQGLGLALLGTAIGLLLSLFVMRIFATLLFDVQPTDPMAFAGAVTLVIGVTLLASLIPAVRASRVDPVVALRRD